MGPDPQHLQEPHPEASLSAEDVAELDLMRKDLAEQKQANILLSADFERFKKRSRLEGEDRALAQKESFIHELLPALDNLERALSSSASTASPQLHQGVAMTLLQLRQLLRKHGFESDESLGQPFDPRQHEAISQRHDPAYPDHAIVEVFQRGYRRGPKIVRPAQVVVNSVKHSKHPHHAHGV